MLLFNQAFIIRVCLRSEPEENFKMLTRLLHAAIITSAFYLIMTFSQSPMQQPSLFSPLQSSTIEVDRFRYFLAKVINFISEPV